MGPITRKAESCERCLVGLVRFNNRGDSLTARQSLKMARSSHAYVPGNTRKFYEWLETADTEAASWSRDLDMRRLPLAMAMMC